MQEKAVIEIPHWITRQFIQSHPEINFIYADDYMGNSYQGQAAHAAGEPNAFPVPTKCIGICRRELAFFSDADYNIHEEKLNLYFDRIPGDKPVVAFPNIGKGDSELTMRAPRLYKYIMKRIAMIEYPNIRRV